MQRQQEQIKEQAKNQSPVKQMFEQDLKALIKIKNTMDEILVKYQKL